jgi:hypothetical protein
MEHNTIFLTNGCTRTHIHTHTLRTKLVKLIKLISMGDRIKNVFTSTINKLRAS